jgi:hypothetical protein
MGDPRYRRARQKTLMAQRDAPVRRYPVISSFRAPVWGCASLAAAPHRRLDCNGRKRRQSHAFRNPPDCG